MTRILLSPCLLVAALVFCTANVQAQGTPEQQAEVLINTARKAFNEHNYPFAAGKYREFLGKFGNHKDAASARYGLALSLIEGIDKNYNEARDNLQQLAGLKGFPERPLVLYYLGIAARGQGINELQLAEGKPPQEQQNRRNVAQQKFTEAAGFFKAGLDALAYKVKGAEVKEGEPLSVDIEWAARARCELAETELRIGKSKEAQATAEPFVKDKLLGRSKFANQGRYYYGYAALLNKDLPAAEKTLSGLAPFRDPVFGNHAEYLLARVHHMADERAEATSHYEAVITGYNTARAEAMKRMQQDQKRYNGDPVFRARIDALVKGPLPDHVARAMFYLGVLQYEAGRFADAKAKFVDFLKLQPQSPLKSDAELRIGFCQVHLKEYAAAIKTLQPLIDREPRLADQSLLWIGKAQAGGAPDPATNQMGYETAHFTAIKTLQQAAERAQRIQDTDPEAKKRRGEILLEIADTMQPFKQHKQSIPTLQQILNEKLLPEREEEVTQRLISALHLARDYAESDNVAQKFLDRFPQSTLRPAVLFTMAENSFFRLAAAEKNPNQAERAKQVAALADDTVKRFQALVEKYPELPKVNLARFSIGLTLYRKGDLEKAKAALDTIPAADRAGDLALTPYLIADITLRQVPAGVPEDALAAGKMEEQLKTSAEQLDAFIGGNPKAPEVPDALIKFGLAQQRLASLLTQPADRNKVLTTAKAAYEKLMSPEHAKSPLVAQAVMERAKVMAAMGDINGGINELRRFTNDPLRQNTRVAPMALLQLATFLRTQNKAAEAADVLAKGRQQHEANLAKDPDRAHWAALLRYHEGVALREAGKLPEARAQFEAVIKTSGQRPEGIEAALRLGQTMKDEGQHKLDAARKLRGSAKKEDQAKQNQLTMEGYKTIKAAVDFLEGQSEQLKKREDMQEPRARMLYEAAWGNRTLAEPELESARAAIAKEMLAKFGAQAAKMPLPDVPLDKVPLQPAEKKARALYQSLIDGFGDLPIATEARFELAELLADRNENDAAVKLLGEVLDKEPPAELTDKVRLRLGSIHAAKGDLKSALGQFDAVANNPKSALIGWAQYRAGEAHLHSQQPDEAVKRLSVFVTNPQLHNVPGLTDRALLRLGYAYGLIKAWDQSRSSYERLVSAFPNSPWTDDGRYGIGWALQQQKNFDAAVNAYGTVANKTLAEVGAKAQLQIGLCRLEQKRPAEAITALMVVPLTYDYPELRAAARFEASKAYSELKQNDMALKQLQLVTQEFPGTPWAEAAKERIGILSGTPKAN